MAPVVALGAVPPRDAVRDQRPIHPSGELLHAGEQRRGTGDDRQGLDQPDIRMTFHRAHQAHQRLAGHQAVGVQDQELLIGAAEAPHPFGDVSRFAGDVPRTAAIEDPPVSARPLAQCQKPRLLGDPDVGIGGVAEDEQVERIARADLPQRLIDRLQLGHDPRRLLVVGRHHQRGARGKPRQRRVRTGAERAPAAGQQRKEAGERAGERQRDPGEQREEQRQHEDRQRSQPIHREHAGTSPPRRRSSGRPRRR